MERQMLRIVAALAVCLAAVHAFAQPALPPVDWKDFAPLLGEWQGDPGAPGGPTGSFTLTPELAGRVLVRKSYAEYPQSAGRPAFRHDDLMVIYRDRDATRADYWDNEGHVIRYVVTIEKGKTIVFQSEAAPGRPRFRLTYLAQGADRLSLRFDIAPPNAPDQWKLYLQATLHRKR
jgi:hypothetical protein